MSEISKQTLTGYVVLKIVENPLRLHVVSIFWYQGLLRLQIPYGILVDIDRSLNFVLVNWLFTSEVRLSYTKILS